METQISSVFQDGDRSFLIEKLSPESADLESKMAQALSICDKHLGEGLYSLETIEKIIRTKHNYFFIISLGHDIIGIFCCYTIRFSHAAQELECKGKYLEDNEFVGICRSIAIENAYRASGISEYLLNMASDILFKNENARLIAVPAWVRRDTGTIPAKRLLEGCGFAPAELILHPWKKYGSVICDACNKNPCECNCELYIKGRNNNG